LTPSRSVSVLISSLIPCSLPADLLLRHGCEEGSLCRRFLLFLRFFLGSSSPVDFLKSFPSLHAVAVRVPFSPGFSFLRGRDDGIRFFMTLPFLFPSCESPLGRLRCSGFRSTRAAQLFHFSFFQTLFSADQPFSICTFRANEIVGWFPPPLFFFLESLRPFFFTDRTSTHGSLVRHFFDSALKAMSYFLFFSTVPHLFTFLFIYI